ncbi:hypothetical protein L1987_81190 [Smallanthus sonchifolius]|uniref:Uncharacterized protein n=1 Tax=Smallanthus sonchifolius TaxID=185202 RepID=A0ACB8YPY9_9ASTR|nr:hypothetical protein L1987_81190 [Smallanthus sonchifolius]
MHAYTGSSPDHQLDELIARLLRTKLRNLQQQCCKSDLGNEESQHHVFNKRECGIPLVYDTTTGIVVASLGIDQSSLGVLPLEEFSTSTTCNSSPSCAPEAYLKTGKYSLSVNNKASTYVKWLRLWSQKNSNAWSSSPMGAPQTYHKTSTISIDRE